MNKRNLHKLIKYEERMGVNTLQNDYYESLFRRTTASYRAKIDRENTRGSAKRKPLETKPSSRRQIFAANRKVLGERNYGETSTSSNDLLSSVRSSKSQVESKAGEARNDGRSIKALVEKTLSQVLHAKHSQELLNNKNQNNISKENSPIRSIVEQVLEEKLFKLRNTARDNNSLFNKSSETGSLRSRVEDIVLQVLKEKLTSLQKEKYEDHNDVETLNKNLQDKLTISTNQDILPREPVAHYNNNGPPLDSPSLVEQLLYFEKADGKSNQNKFIEKAKTKKGISNKQTANGCITRLQRSSRQKPEWQDPSLHDKILDKPVKAITAQSLATSSNSNALRGRGKYSTSVLIRRSKSQGRKPNSDPVALYQYYKNEWEHFRKQIPGETSHENLRWHVRQRLLDPQ